MTREEIAAHVSRIRTRFLEDPRGFSAERALSDLADRAVCDAWAAENPSGEWAALAVGGYGRRELHPGSDLDLLFFSEDRLPRREWILRMLARLEHVPFPAEAEPAVGSDFAVFDPDRAFIYGAFLDARFLFGDEATARTLTVRVLPEFVARYRVPLIEALVSMRDETIREQKDPGTALDLKNSRGALADHRWIRWMRRLAGSGAGLTGAEADRVEAAAAFLRSVRTALHFVSGNAGNVLDRGHQPEVGWAVGIRTSGKGDADRLIAECGKSIRAISGAADSVARHASKSADNP